ncbi:MAG: type II toxin-antitoxin system RelE/ParE family toxin [Deltaproteobacteria bacterium]|nr:type II toxin-antitoxin system RelE/ParE family toxin [Deltaproteobacteria bacterium]
MRQLTWLGSSRRDVRGFPDDARKRTGYELYLVQSGTEPTDWKAMPSVGLGVQEIRIHTKLEHRVLYVTRLEESIYVLHAFEKKARKTAREDIELARTRLKALLNARRTARKSRNWE